MVESKKKDFYGSLGVEKTATPAEIKSAYKKLALVSHNSISPLIRIALEMAPR